MSACYTVAIRAHTPYSSISFDIVRFESETSRYLTNSNITCMNSLPDVETN
jgi:hypothetical protein